MRSFRLFMIALMLVVLLPGLAPAAAQQTCGNAPAPRLTPGQQARVVVSDGTGNNLRAAASANPNTTVLGVMADGEIFNVLSGPQCADNYWWWQVRRWDGQTGWTAEGAGGEYWIEPWPAAGAQYATGRLPEVDNLHLAYVSGDPAALQPFAIQVKTRAVVSLAPMAVSDNLLAWSPDGTQVAFSDETDIFVATPSSTRTLTASTPNSGSYWPSWSPDGARIAFVSERDGNPEIYSMRADGSDVKRLTNDPAADMMPAWSPDGTRIAFASERDGNFEIYVMNADGSNTARLTTLSDTQDTAPVWSPDATKIAFVGAVEGADGSVESSNIFVIQEDESVLAITLEGRNSNPVWSPDGERLAYIGETPAGSGQYELFSADAGDTARYVIQYTVSGSEFAGVAWSPDGNWLAFSSALTGSYDIFLLRSSGAGLINLTNSPTADDMAPFWQPAPVALAVQPGATPVPGAVTATPPATALASNPAPQDLLLIYDASVPVFTLKNVSGQPINLFPVNFSGAGVTVPASIWNTEFVSSPLHAFMAGGCLMIWRYGLPDQAAPAECGTARQGWIADEQSVFWTQGTFQVLYNGVVATTCDVAAGRCIVDLP